MRQGPINQPTPQVPGARRFAEASDPELQDAHRRLHQPLDEAGHHRRKFLQGMLLVGGVTALGVPMLSSKNAEAGPPLGPNDHILITLLLDGGNDGLNTVVPLDNGRYQDMRGPLAIRAAGAHPVGEGLYLHPNLSRLSKRFNAGKVAIIQGVGEPSDDHSHFQSMARWMAGTANPSPWFNGYLGRYLDGIGGDESSGVAIGSGGVPLHLTRPVGETTAVPGWGGLFGVDYDANNYNRATYDAMLNFNAGALNKGHWAEQVALTNSRAISTADTLGGMFNPEINIENPFIRDAELVSRLVNLDVGARVISMSLGGFDHHADQRPHHDDHLDYIDRAIERIFDRIKPSLRGRVLIMTMSEFGRRPDYNGSGSDHGTANNMFVVGENVTGGLYGNQPSLKNLDERGDLRHNVDFRSMYATVLDDWLDADSGEILGANYDNLGFLSQTCNGEEATIVGTGSRETIHGTAGRDVIVGLGGADTIYGHGGDDPICAGPGNDTVFGDAGNDDIFGDTGDDDIRGGDGTDYLRGGTGHDQVHGGRGADTLRGNSGSDQLFGKRSEDTFISGVSDAILRGSDDAATPQAQDNAGPEHYWCPRASRRRRRGQRSDDQPIPTDQPAPAHRPCGGGRLLRSLARDW
jgi:uncharacterized protein (DUF1501 family)